MMEEDIREAFLYIGVDLKNITPDIYATFRGVGQIPVSWFFLFSDKEIKTRQEIMPESIGLFQGEFENDPNYEQKFKNFVTDPVAFETTIPQAQERLSKFKKIFAQIPYFWSYFRVIELLEEHLENQINLLTEKSIADVTPTIQGSHPDPALSQVRVKEERDEDASDIELDALSAITNFGFDNLPPISVDKDELLDEDALIDNDNPFADLLEFGQSTQTPVKPADDPSMLDENLMDQLFAATQLDADEITDEPDEPELDQEIQPALVITAKFDHLAIDSYGEKIRNIFVRIDNLFHHIIREGGRQTRIMIDIFQDIFRESTSEWRITGLLSEDFVQADPANLRNIMIGDPSAFNSLSKVTFDLNYWTKGTLQQGDERLMFTLSKLPSEDLHKLLMGGEFQELDKIIEKTLVMTRSQKKVRYSSSNLSKTPIDSNIWGIRVLLPHGDTYRAATLLSQSNEKSWSDDFLERIDLPGVLTDWNIEYNIRFSEFSDAGKYKIVFKRADGKDDTFKGFIRWLRRHHAMYENKFGIAGTIRTMKDRIINTEDSAEGQTLFNLLTSLSGVGFNDAITALTEPDVVNRLEWIYSSA